MTRISDETRSRMMASIRSKDTKPEMIVRRLVHGMGFRYRLHRKSLPGTPDLSFISKKKVIFVHGCFWHQHDDETCINSNMPKRNRSYWADKLKRNVERDKENIKRLLELGWHVLVVWECETKRQDELAMNLKQFLDNS